MKSSNTVWHHGEIEPNLRSRLLGQKGTIVWFTGLSGSGKSTVSRRVERLLLERAVFAYVLDGDNLRHGLNGDLGFSAEDRVENIRRVRSVAQLFADAEVVVLCAFISPYRADRDAARALVDEGRFVEVYCDVDVDVCAERDPKGLYEKARAGEIQNFTGISAPYEEPLEPEVRLDTESESLDESANKVVDYLLAQGIVSQ